jgi:hypothetical protein
MDVFTRITDRLRDVNIVYALNFVCATLDLDERLRMQQDSAFKREFSEL